MRKLSLLLLMSALPAMAQSGSVNGVCSLGGTRAAVSGIQSTNYLQGVVPSCTVTVYLTGTQSKATITSNGTTPLANPFVANTSSSTNSGGWLFYAATNAGLDVCMSGGIAPNVFPSPVCLTDIFPSSGGGGGGGGNVSGPHDVPGLNNNSTVDNSTAINNAAATGGDFGLPNNCQGSNGNINMNAQWAFTNKSNSNFTGSGYGLPENAGCITIGNWTDTSAANVGIQLTSNSGGGMNNITLGLMNLEATGGPGGGGPSGSVGLTLTGSGGNPLNDITIQQLNIAGFAQAIVSNGAGNLTLGPLMIQGAPTVSGSSVSHGLAEVQLGGSGNNSTFGTIQAIGGSSEIAADGARVLVELDSNVGNCIDFHDATGGSQVIQFGQNSGGTWNGFYWTGGSWTGVAVGCANFANIETMVGTWAEVGTNSAATITDSGNHNSLNSLAPNYWVHTGGILNLTSGQAMNETGPGSLTLTQAAASSSLSGQYWYWYVADNPGIVLDQATVDWHSGPSGIATITVTPGNNVTITLPSGAGYNAPTQTVGNATQYFIMRNTSNNSQTAVQIATLATGTTSFVDTGGTSGSFTPDWGTVPQIVFGSNATVRETCGEGSAAGVITLGKGRQMQDAWGGYSDACNSTFAATQHYSALPTPGASNEGTLTRQIFNPTGTGQDHLPYVWASWVSGVPTYNLTDFAALSAKVNAVNCPVGTAGTAWYTAAAACTIATTFPINYAANFAVDQLGLTNTGAGSSVNDVVFADSSASNTNNTLALTNAATAASPYLLRLQDSTQVYGFKGGATPTFLFPYIATFGNVVDQGLASGATQCVEATVGGELMGTGNPCPGGGSTTVQTNGVANASSNPLNFQTSTINADGLTITPHNPSSGNETMELSGVYYGVTGLNANAVPLATGANTITASSNLSQNGDGSMAFSKTAAWANCQLITASASPTTTTLDLHNSNCAVITANAANVVLAFSNPDTAAGPFQIGLCNDAGGSRSWTLSANLKQIGTPNNTPASTCVYTSLFFDGTNYQGLGSSEAASILRGSVRAAPATPASGAFASWWDSTDLDFETINSAGSIFKAFLAGADCNPVTGICTTSNGVPIVTTTGTQTLTNKSIAASEVNSGTLAIANGGTGSSSPSLVAGSNITITGSWPNQTIASSGGGGGVNTVTASNGVSASGSSAVVLVGSSTPRYYTGTTDTIVAGDCGNEVFYSNAAAITVTVPQAGTTGFPNGCKVKMSNSTAGGLPYLTTTTSLFLLPSSTTGNTFWPYFGLADTVAITSDGTNWKVSTTFPKNLVETAYSDNCVSSIATATQPIGIFSGTSNPSCVLATSATNMTNGSVTLPANLIQATTTLKVTDFFAFTQGTVSSQITWKLNLGSGPTTVWSLTSSTYGNGSASIANAGGMQEFYISGTAAPGSSVQVASAMNGRAFFNNSTGFTTAAYYGGGIATNTGLLFNQNVQFTTAGTGGFIDLYKVIIQVLNP